MLWTDKPISLSVNNPVVTNEGASFGPRVGTVSFYGHPRTGWRTNVILYADFDGREWQDEPVQKRKGAQAVVPIGRRAASAIAAGEVMPTFERDRDRDWVMAIFQIEDTSGPHARRAKACHSFHSPAGLGSPQLPDGVRERLAKLMRDTADALHMSVHDPRNEGEYGTWKSADSRPRPAGGAQL